MSNNELQFKESDKKLSEDKIIVVRNSSNSYSGKALGLDNLSTCQLESIVKNIENLL